MKRLLQNLLLLGSLFLISFSAAAEYNVSCSPTGFSYEFNVNLQEGPLPTNPEREVATITGTSLSGDINIPDYVTVTYHFNKYNTKIKYPIRYIGENAFKNNTDLTSVNIPESILWIGSSAFSGCTGLTSITIPNSETGIGASAFAGCTGLTSITIPNSVTNIGDNAFARCLNLANINFNAECNSMGSSNNPVFEECPLLQNLIIGESVKSIPEYAFKCSGLRNVTIPEQITSIGKGAFSKCENLTKVNYNAIDCSSNYSAFSTNSASASLKIGDKVITIPSYIFSYWSGLNDVVISNSVSYIGAATFRNCIGLTEVTIPNSVVRIGDKAFADCSNLTTVNFNAKNCTFMGVNFDGTTFNNSPLQIVNIGNEVKIIPDRAFYELSTEITIPESVTNIGEYAFTNCKTIIYNAQSCSSIGKNAFINCTTLDIGNTVKTIPCDAFSSCLDLFIVTCFPTTPPILTNSSFNSVVFRVPQKQAYSKADVWNKYHLVEFDENIVPKENCIYRTLNGIVCENKWINDRIHSNNLFVSHPFMKQYAIKARSTTIDPIRKKIYIGYSKTSEYSNDYAHLIIFNFETGEYEKELILNINGNFISGLLSANQIGVDDFGNVWFAGCNLEGPTKDNPIKVYIIEDLETGACRQVGEWYLPTDENANAGRVEYYDVVGDITGMQANAVAMTAVRTFGGNNVNGLYRWELEKGDKEWQGGFSGKVSTTITDTYPKTEDGWGADPIVKIMKENESDFSGSCFYVDGSNTYPALYNKSLTMTENFSESPYLPNKKCNGVSEFSLRNRQFIAYAESQYTDKPGCRVNICELGDNGSFDEMEYYWSIPEAGLGNSSNTSRQHSIENYKVVDKNGKEGVYLLTYYCFNGIGLYLIAEEGFDETSIASTEKIGIDNIAPNSNAVEIARYDIHGRKLSEPAKGVNIIKMSDGTTRKELVR